MELFSILPILKRIPLFADLTEEQHKEVISQITLNYLPAGYVFFKEGEQNGGMFIIKRGTVKISRRDPVLENEKEVAILHDNDFFGEMALVTNEPRNATATATADCEVFQLKKEDFIKLIETSPTMASTISNEFLDRVKKNTRAQFGH